MEGTPPGPQGPQYPHDQPPTQPQPGYAGPPNPDPGGYPPTYAQQPPPQGYGQPPYQGPGQGHQGPGMGQRANDAMQSFQEHIRTPETKPFFRSSEFAVWLLTVIGVLIAGAAVDSGVEGDPMRADTVWLFVTAISFAYIISRGISKAGTKYQDEHRRRDH